MYGFEQVSMAADSSKQGYLQSRARALESLRDRVGRDQTGNDDGREDSELLTVEVNGLDMLLAAQLLDLERVAIKTAYIESRIEVLLAADSKRRARAGDRRVWVAGQLRVGVGAWGRHT